MYDDKYNNPNFLDYENTYNDSEIYQITKEDKYIFLEIIDKLLELFKKVITLI
ncbi:hypothetical protein [Methanobrevibacter sp. DSM 116169]|uniref:hypothetical protein n=1 Tax=Methanobrevibacter sp. DSM 116169 TaxID=3242727 RepID=UPI0038FD0F88